MNSYNTKGFSRIPGVERNYLDAISNKKLADPNICQYEYNHLIRFCKII
jgi:hypothetical protein